GRAGQSRSTDQKEGGRRRGAAGDPQVRLLRFTADVKQAADNLRAQKTRTLLTALGIVFGVGSVIGMLAIGAGAKEESLRFIEKLGVRNLLVESRPATSREELQERRRTSPGTDRPRRAHPRNEYRRSRSDLRAAHAAAVASPAQTGAR